MTKSENTVSERPPQVLQEGWLPYWLHWKPTSMFRLALAEARLLNNLNCNIKSKFVKVLENEYLNTIVVKSHTPDPDYERRTPIVLVHGMGAGVGLWCKNLEELCKNRRVFAFDLLGFGRSSRPKFSDDPEEAEETLVNSINDFQQRMNLDEFILIGHSFGGYLAFSYTLKYPNKVKHLVLLDPWGFPVKKQLDQEIPPVVRAAIKLASVLYPLSLIRAAGPFGPSLIKTFRRDLKYIFSQNDDEENEFVLDYIYHCNAQNPSGEAAFKVLNEGLGWAKMPMLDRAESFEQLIPMSFIHGRRSWIDQSIGVNMKRILPEAKIDIRVIEGAGHHVYAEKAAVTNYLINLLSDDLDDDLETQNIS